MFTIVTAFLEAQLFFWLFAIILIGTAIILAFRYPTVLDTIVILLFIAALTNEFAHDIYSGLGPVKWVLAALIVFFISVVNYYNLGYYINMLICSSGITFFMYNNLSALTIDDDISIFKFTLFRDKNSIIYISAIVIIFVALIISHLLGKKAAQKANFFAWILTEFGGGAQFDELNAYESKTNETNITLCENTFSKTDIVKPKEIENNKYKNFDDFD